MSLHTLLYVYISCRGPLPLPPLGQSPALQHSMGAFMARVTKALAGFQHAGVPQEGPWCMNTATTTIRTRVTGLNSISDGQRWVGCVSGGLVPVQGCTLKVGCWDGLRALMSGAHAAPALQHMLDWKWCL